MKELIRGHLYTNVTIVQDGQVLTVLSQCCYKQPAFFDGPDCQCSECGFMMHFPGYNMSCRFLLENCTSTGREEEQMQALSFWINAWLDRDDLDVEVRWEG